MIASPFHIPGFVRFILRRLKERGHDAFVVGGAVRDFCLGRPIADWDVAASASAEEIRLTFHDVRQFCLHEDTVTLVDGAALYEVTPFRGDGSGPPIVNDLGRRDFTINAMAYDEAKGEILDPWGGRGDLLNRRITFRSNRRHREAAPRFMIVAALGLSLNTLFMYLHVALLGVNYLIGQVISTGIVLMSNFLANRHWTFRTRSC